MNHELTLTISPSHFSKDTPALGKNGGGSVAVLPPVGKTSVERINLEPIYAQLKAALGESWNDYKTALSTFVQGGLNQAELSWVLQPLLTPVPIMIPGADPAKAPASTLHLHNQLLISMYSNTLRDAPATDVAPWVVATDKPSSTAKNTGAGGGANDKAEERLKREIMNFHPRDRQRIKALKEEGPRSPRHNVLRQMIEYGDELAAKPPGTGSGQNDAQAATPGLARNNFDIEIQRRYAQPLASEQLEFPSHNDLQSKIEPISYERGLTGGVQQGMQQSCSDLLEQATEVFIKEMLSGFLAHARSNAVGREGVQTHRFRRQLRKEEDDAERGVLQRNSGGMLPVEMQMQASRQPLTMADMRLSLGLSDGYLKQDPFLQERIQLKHYPVMAPPTTSGPDANGFSGHVTNGVRGSGGGGANHGDAMDLDDFDYGMYKGVGKGDHDNIMGALDDCLLAPG